MEGEVIPSFRLVLWYKVAEMVYSYCRTKEAMTWRETIKNLPNLISFSIRKRGYGFFGTHRAAQNKMAEFGLHQTPP